MVTITLGEEARKKLLAGVDAAANAVGATYGPRGRNAIIYRGEGDKPLSTRDGVTVARNIDLVDPMEDAGAQIIRQASEKTNTGSGDGTTCSAVLAQVLYREGLKLVSAGISPVFLKRGIDLGVEAICQHLKDIAVPVYGDKITQIATISANNDKVLGELIASAVRAAGKDGVITVEDSPIPETTLEKVEGMQLRTGYKSPYFITDPLKMEAVLEDARVLVFEKKLGSFTPGLRKFLEAMTTSQSPLLVLAEDVEGDVLATLVVNRMKASRYWCAAKLPLGSIKGTLEDIAILTGGKAITGDLGIGDDNIPLDCLGKASKIVVSEKLTIISGGAGSKQAIANRIAEIRVQLEKAETDFEKDKLQERLARLSGGVSIIRVGASSEVELQDKKLRIEDALHATRAAVEEGIVPGGGVALVRSGTSLDALCSNPDEVAGIGVLRKALNESLARIASNAGQNGQTVVDKVLANTNPNFGYNALTDKYEDLFEAGIIDPVKVIKMALTNAASVATQLLITEVLITAIPEKGQGGFNGIH